MYYSLARTMACILVTLTFAFAGSAAAAEAQPVLGAVEGVPHRGHMLYQRLLVQVDEFDRQRVEAVERLDGREAIVRRQEELRRHFLDAIGELPERTPLNARVTGTLDRNGYSIEKILFESRPGHYVTAALFLPDPERFAPPWPGIAVSCGHAPTGKASRNYQSACILAARNGMAALIYDPFDQGERMQLLDAEGEPKEYNMAGHNRVGVNAIMVGWSAANFMIWDGMRAIDYLQSRPDIDAQRIGATGNSGGGTLTAYLAALDSRVVASAPSCYIDVLSIELARIGPPDAEQCIYGQLAFGMDKAEYLWMSAPAPVRVCAATRDVLFPIAGVRSAVALARTVFERLEVPERIDMAEWDGPHNWSADLRAAAIGWLSHWLRGANAPFEIPDPLPGPPSAAQVQVTPNGQTLLLDGARSTYDLMRDEAERLATQRERRGPLSPVDLQRAVRHRAVIRPLAELPSPEPRDVGESRHPWGVMRRLAFEVEPNLFVPALLYLPDNAAEAPVLYADGGGKAAAAAEARALAERGHPVLSVDLRGFGETRSVRHRRGLHGPTIADDSDGQIAYLLGRPLTGQRAEDVLMCARWLRGQFDERRLVLGASGWAVTPALHAAAAEPDMFEGVTLSGRPMSWSESITQSARHRFADVVPGALIDYSLAELAEAVKARVEPAADGR